MADVYKRQDVSFGKARYRIIDIAEYLPIIKAANDSRIKADRDKMCIRDRIIIAIVEGLTEFLPVSSTGHMIITQNLLGIESTEFVKAYTALCTGALCNGIGKGI